MHIPKFLALLFLIAVQSYAVPVSFEQRDSKHFLTRFANGTGELRSDGLTMRDVTLRFLGASGEARLEGLGSRASSTYLRARLARTFPLFPKLAIHQLYPGIDAVFYGSGDNLEYDLNVAAGVSIRRVRISFERARDIRVDDKGNLSVATASGVFQQMRPRVFQGNREISARYVLLGANEAGIRLGKYDRRLPLTIDPVLDFVKYFGANGLNEGTVLATDSQGDIYLGGQSNSVDFPTTSKGFEPKLTPPLQVLSNAGKTIKPLLVGAETMVGVVGGSKDGAILYAATPDGIFLSGDSGATWRQSDALVVPGLSSTGRTLTVNAISLDPQDPSTLLVATNVGLFGSDSGGQDGWGESNTGLPVSASGFVNVSSVFYSPVNPLVAYATTSNPSYLCASLDGGNTWQILNPAYPGEPPTPGPSAYMAATLSPDGGTLYAINGNGNLFKSLDGGKTWERLAAGLYGPVSIQLDPANSSTIYVFDQLGMAKSTDGGETFSGLATPGSTRGFAIDSTGALYLQGLTQIYISSDSGKTFTSSPQLASLNLINLTAVAGKVYAGAASPSIPFVMKLDPTGSNILYSTFLGGSAGDGAQGLAVDSKGEAVLVGYSASPDFPFTAPAANPPLPGRTDGFVAKLSADGTRLIYSISLAGAKGASIQAVALDSSGAAYVAGDSYGSDFPTTSKAFQPAIPSSVCPRTEDNPFQLLDTGTYAFVSKIAASGSPIEYSTFLTGSCGSASGGITVDSSGDAIVVGSTTSPDFPVSAGSYQSTFPFPPVQSGQAIDNAGFVTKLSPAGDKIIASTYVGGGYATLASGVALDAADNTFVTGFTQGIAPGATPGAFQSMLQERCEPIISIGPSAPNHGTGDAYVLKLDSTLSSAGALTYLGGSCNDSGSNIVLDAAGNIWVSGVTQSPDFPLKEPFQAGGIYTASTPGFVTELNPDASELLFSSLSDGTALAATPTAVYFAGGNGTSAFVAKIDPAATPAVGIDSIFPVVAFPPLLIAPATSGVAPGLLVQIAGHNLGPAAKVSAKLDALGRLPFTLGNTIVYFDDIPAPLISVQAESIVCYVPFEIGSITHVAVSSNGEKSNSVRIGVLPSTPQILTILNQDGTVNSAAHPAKLGSVITLYVSGLGETNPLSVDGLVNAPPLAVPLAPVTVNVPGFAINPQFVGAAPGMIAGITQVNVLLPVATPAGANPMNISVNNAQALVYVTK